MKLKRLLAIAYKETLQIWRDPRSLAIALLMPLMQMGLLGYGVSLDVRHVALCVYDQENSQISRALVQDFASSNWFAVVRQLHNEAELRDAMDRSVCIGAITIASNFTRTLDSSGTASVQAIFDATDVNTTNIAIGYAQGVIALVTADFERNWLRMHGELAQTVGSVDLEPRVMFNEALDSRNFIIPGVVAVILGLVGAQLTSLTVSREWERGTMEQLIAAIFWFRVPFRGAFGTLAATTMLYTLVVLGIGYLVSVRIRSQLGASQVALLLTMLPTTLLSGYTFPIDQMPHFVQMITYAVYPRYFVTILRAVFLKGSGLSELIGPILALVVFAVLIIRIAARSFHKRLDER